MGGGVVPHVKNKKKKEFTVGKRLTLRVTVFPPAVKCLEIVETVCGLL